MERVVARDPKHGQQRIDEALGFAWRNRVLEEPLIRYLHDHLAGARFAVALLNDLSEQETFAEVRTASRDLLPNVEQDRLVLERLAAEFGDETNVVKEGLAWLAQKAGKVKLRMADRAGVYEAVELLSLGVLGKLALWNTLIELAGESRLAHLDLDALCQEATRQHGELEKLRRGLAVKTFGRDSTSRDARQER